jgi:hypothetical protein
MAAPLLAALHDPSLERTLPRVNSITLALPTLSSAPNNAASSQPVPHLTLPIQPPPFAPSSAVILDTGCTSHFLTMSGPYVNAQPAYPGLDVQLPSGALMRSTHTAILDIPSLPLAARHCHLFPELTSGSLISIGQLCDHGCTAAFDATSVAITYANHPVLVGTRSPSTGLWQVLPTVHNSTKPLPNDQCIIQPNPQHFPAHALAAHSTIAEQVAFYHATMFYPSVATWCKAIDAGFLTTWPALTSVQVRRHLPFAAPMIKGHLDQQRANQQSTKVVVVPTPPAIQSTTRSHAIYVDCQPATGQIHSDLTGRFLTASSRGNSYLLIVYDYDSNYIHAEPMKSRGGPEIIAAYQRTFRMFTSRGLTPKFQRLDNEASTALQDYLQEQGVDYQLVPPHVHRRNAAERAIRTFKNHFIAGLCGTDQNFPLHLWDRMLPQALLTLNLLRASHLNPRLSAQAMVHGAFDFNRTPLAPPGTRVLVHEKPTVRGTWAPHAVDGWYLGPALHHYRCYSVWIWETASERIADTLAWFPTKVTMPVHSSADAAIDAAQALTKALLNPAPASPLAPLSDQHQSALRQLAAIFTSSSTLPGPTTIAPPCTPLVPPGFTPLAPLLPPTTLTPPIPAALPRVVLSPTPSLPTDLTYTHVSGNPGKRRRAAKRAQHRQAATPAAAVELVPRHSHNTRNRGRNHHVVTVRPAGTQFVALCQAFKGSEHPVSPPLAACEMDCPASTDVVCHPPQPNQPAVLLPTQPPSVWHSAHAVLDPATGASLSYRQLQLGPDGAAWLQSAANEIGRLAQGVLPHMPHGTDTMHFIAHDAVPSGRQATYLRIVAEERPLKAETKRVRFTVGGNRIDYPGKVSTPTADLTTVKLLLNSVISTPGARFATADISNFYLNNPMERYEYMRIPVRDIPACIMHQYALTPLIHTGHVMVEIRKGMYGLPQAGIIANTRLQKHLGMYGYAAVAHTAGLFQHATRPITFCLTVDDFAVKYVGKEHADHLFAALQDIYTITLDWSGTKYCGLTLAWDYTAGTVDMSMPGYIAKALHRFQHVAPKRPQHSPHAWVAPTYGAATQLTAPPDQSPALDAKGATRIQEVVGVLLYYARAVDSTMLVALGTIASAAKSADTAQAITQLLNYCATHPDAIVRFHASDMVLHVHSDASYLSEAHARSRAGGYFFLSDKPAQPLATPDPTCVPPPLNGPVHTPCTIMRVVLSSATEAEMGALFYNAKDAAWLRTTLLDLGHPQPPTPIQTDNACAAGIINDTVKQRRSKAIDMRFYWVRDRVRQQQFLVHWRKGSDNLADYFTKHHSPSHHRLMRSRYLLDLHRPPVPAGPLPLAPCPPSSLPLLGEGVLRTPKYSSGFPVLTQNVTALRTASRSVVFADHS